jgi:hypothetical protein
VNYELGKGNEPIISLSDVEPRSFLGNGLAKGIRGIPATQQSLLMFWKDDLGIRCAPSCACDLLYLFCVVRDCSTNFDIARAH